VRPTGDAARPPGWISVATLYLGRGHFGRPRALLRRDPPGGIALCDPSLWLVGPDHSGADRAGALGRRADAVDQPHHPRALLPVAGGYPGGDRPASLPKCPGCPLATVEPAATERSAERGPALAGLYHRPV